MKNSQDAIRSQVELSLETQASVYSESILDDINNYANTLDICNKIILAALQEDNTLYDFKLVEAFPVIGPNRAVTMFTPIPPDLQTNNIQLTGYYSTPVSLETWTWGAFRSPDKITLSTRGQELYYASDVLNYILGDLYYSKQITNIDYIYSAFYQDGFMYIFPGIELFSSDTTYDPLTRPWFVKMEEIVKKVGIQSNPFRYDPIITDYRDFNAKSYVMTLTLPIINQNKQLLGCTSIDIVTDTLDKYFQLQDLPSEYVIYMVNDRGSVINNPLNVNYVIDADSSNVTNITRETWESITEWGKQQQAEQNVTKASKIITATNTDGENIMLGVSISIQPISRQYIMIIIYTPEYVAMAAAIQLKEQMNREFHYIEINSSITIAVTCAIAFLMAYFFSYRIVKPLSDLTIYAQQINQNITNQKMGLIKKQKKINLDQIKAQDKIGELIDAFKNLIQGLAGLKKGNKRDTSASQKLIEFPINQYQELGWEEIINKIRNQDEMEKQPISKQIEVEQDILINDKIIRAQQRLGLKN